MQDINAGLALAFIRPTLRKHVRMRMLVSTSTLFL